MFLSIIIPVYNLQNYLNDCLESCLEQDFDDYEIICINDGSNDSSQDILYDYAVKYTDKIVVINKENGGVSSARNVGIDKAKGKWIWFVDGDDCIRKNCLEELKQLVEEKNCDIVSLQNIMIADNTSNSTAQAMPIQSKYEDNTSMVTLKWFRKSVIEENKLMFREELTRGEDIVFLNDFLMKTDKKYVYNKPVYFYRYRPSSAIRKKTDKYFSNLCFARFYIACYYQELIVNYDSSRDRLPLNYLEERKNIFLQKGLGTLAFYERKKTVVKNYLSKLHQLNMYPNKKAGLPNQMGVKAKLYNLLGVILSNSQACFWIIWYIAKIFNIKRFRAN